jgi:hypothetical protein
MIPPLLPNYQTISSQTGPMIIFCPGNKFKQPEKAEKKDCEKKQLPGYPSTYLNTLSASNTRKNGKSDSTARREKRCIHPHFR